MRKLHRRSSKIVLGGISLLLCSLASVSLASPPEPSSPPKEKSSSFGLRAYIDPETGELTSAPSPAQVETLNQALEQISSSSNEDLEQFELRSGGRGVFLGGRFPSALVMQWSEDGAHRFFCIEDESETNEVQPSQSETTWAER